MVSYIEHVYLVAFADGKQFVGQSARTLTEYLYSFKQPKYLNSAPATKRKVLTAVDVAVIFTGPSAEARAVVRRTILELNTSAPSGYNNPSRIL